MLIWGYSSDTKLFKRRKRNLSVPAHVVSTDGDVLVVEVETNNVNYKKGQIATAIVSTRERNWRKNV